MAHDRRSNLKNNQGIKKAGDEEDKVSPMIRVNGYWIKTEVFLSDPEKYNNRAINPEYLKEVLG